MIHWSPGPVTGDTKVVQKGGADKLFINTAGLGVVEAPVRVSAARAEVGDKVILSGTVGDHGTTIMIARGELELETDIRSDTAPLHSLVREMLDEAARASGADAVHTLRDPTRGGVATTLNEIALASADGLRRHAHRGHARRRAAPQNLLTAVERDCHGNIRRRGHGGGAENAEKARRI